MRWTSVFIFIFSLNSFAGIGGIYKGFVHYTANVNPAYDVPLAIALTPTGEMRPVPSSSGIFQEEQVIDGSFTIDEEGGPYTFAKVSFRVEENIVDLRYDRPNLIASSVPASFRLIGKIVDGGKIVGKAVSGNRGYIGDFEVSPTNFVTLPLTDKYIGKWTGWKSTAGKTQSLTLSIAASGQLTKNPRDHEFEFTAGRLSAFMIGGTSFPMSSVVFDYLRRTVFFVQQENGQSVIFQGAFDPVSQKISGFSGGRYAGWTGTFELQKVVQ